MQLYVMPIIIMNEGSTLKNRNKTHNEQRLDKEIYESNEEFAIH